VAGGAHFEYYEVRSLGGGKPRVSRPGELVDPTDVGEVGEVREWRWRLRAANGEVVASGEGFTREFDALRGIEAVRDAVLDACGVEQAPMLRVEKVDRPAAAPVFRGDFMEREPDDAPDEPEAS
jgi:uncharacterized protein YegP (UPF0339 family)